MPRPLSRKALKIILIQREITHQEIAEKLGAARQNVTLAVNGDTRFPILRARIAKFLRLPVWRMPVRNGANLRGK